LVLLVLVGFGIGRWQIRFWHSGAP
jgi:hypothetical protein